MATITIKRDLTVRAVDKISTLIPVFVRNSIAFNVVGLAAEILGSYATVKIGAYEFRTVKTVMNGTIHLHVIDLSNVLASLLTTSMYTDIEPELLTLTQAIEIKLYSSTGVLITSVNHPLIKLCLAYSDINTYSEVDIYAKGSSRPIYHNGKLHFFWNGAGGVVKFNNGLSSFSLGVNEKEYNLLDFSSATTLDKTGTLTSPALATFSIPIFYKPPYGEHEIAWLNRDGGWSFWNFRQVSSEIKVKKSNEVETYYPTNYQTISKSRMISADKTVEYVFDTLAYNPEHFAQLCEIQESLAVIWNNKLMTVSGCNSLTAVYKQNLRFTLKLEVDENIAGY